jgi:hypothetical protein
MIYDYIRLVLTSPVRFVLGCRVEFWGGIRELCRIVFGITQIQEKRCGYNLRDLNRNAFEAESHLEQKRVPSFSFDPWENAFSKRSA